MRRAYLTSALAPGLPVTPVKYTMGPRTKKLTRLALYGAALASSVALSVAVTVPLAATVLVMKKVLEGREQDLARRRETTEA